MDYDKKTVTIDGQTFNEGDFLSIDGTAGTVYAGQIKTAPSEIIAGLLNGDKAAQATEKFKNFVQLMKWCSQGHAPARPHQRRHAGADRATPSRSARSASASRARNTCSSRATALTRCAK